MAEFCPECWDKICGTNDARKKYVLSDDLDLCEECGELKNVIVCIKRSTIGKIRHFFVQLKVKRLRRKFRIK